MRIFGICLILLSTSVFAEAIPQQADAHEPNWDRDLAMQSARKSDAGAEAEYLFQLVRHDGGQEFLQALDEMSSRAGWSDPMYEAVILKFAEKLRGLPPNSVEPDVLNFLLTYQNQVLVAHEESPAIAIPLFPIRATAHGMVNQWARLLAEQEAVVLLHEAPEYLVETYASGDINVRAGIEAAIGHADIRVLEAILDFALRLLPTRPEITGLAGSLALASGDLQALIDVFIQGAGPSLVELSRQAGKRYKAAQLGDLLLATLDHSPASTAAVLIAEWAPLSLSQDEVSQAIRGKLDDPELGGSAAMALAGQSFYSLKSSQQTTEGTNPPKTAADEAITSWTEADGTLGLGYPVPIPVNTPLPFDGFRTYNGLHTRHQSLMADTDIVHGEVVGTTHNGRDIWAYRIGDADLVSHDGRPEPATLTNGGIHAREWQTPEIVTGIMELFAENQGDHHFYDFLLDNVNMVVLPVQNVDGFLQTQRFPTQNWLNTDPNDPENDPQPSPRDGRMRRKNMPGVDEVLTTKNDHLFGIDLNRNNAPFWNTNPNLSSSEPRSIVYHGESAGSEPETQALMAAAALGPVSQLRAYTDVHSFSQYFYFQRTANNRLNSNTIDVIYTMRRYMSEQPGGTSYQFTTSSNPELNAGYGLTHEWFTSSLQIPAWGIEIEPSGGQPGLPGNPPGGGADYGGLSRNFHDGFILPESQIRRVREELAHSFASVYYQQAGPPSIAGVRFVDLATDAVIFEAEWDPVSDTERQLFVNQVQPLQLGRDYLLRVAYDRPMRWRDNGEIAILPGQPVQSLRYETGGFVGDSELTSEQSDVQWINTPGGSPGGYYRYKDDSAAVEIRFPDSQVNQGLITKDTLVTLHNKTTNMTYQALDTDPSSAVTWENGGWAGYEADNGQEIDIGGTDKTIQFMISPDTQPDPFVVEPGISAAWFDPTHDGEGFLIEILPDNRAVMYWFTFDDDGEQAWYLAAGDVVGNQLVFPELVQTDGGVFGPDFDPDTVERTVVGSATFTYKGCSSGTMVYQLPGRKGRLNLQRVSRIMGANCGNYLGPPERPEEIQSGSWYNAAQDGHGFIIEILSSGQVLVYWFTYDLAGNQAWFLGVGDIENGDLVIAEVFQTHGPVFGPGFDPNDLELIPWGNMRFTLSCNTGSVTYDGTLAGFGTNTIELERLSTLAGLECE